MRPVNCQKPRTSVIGLERSFVLPSLSFCRSLLPSLVLPLSSLSLVLLLSSSLSLSVSLSLSFLPPLPFTDPRTRENRLEQQALTGPAASSSSSVASSSSAPPSSLLRGFSASAAASSKPAPYSFSPPGRNHLFVPGPVNIHENVLRAMDRPSQNHRDPWFAPFFKECLEDSKMIFGTKKGTPFIYPGTGTGGWESALTNTLSPGDKVVTFRYGQFSHLWIGKIVFLSLFSKRAFVFIFIFFRRPRNSLFPPLSFPLPRSLLPRILHPTPTPKDMMQRLGLDVQVIECEWGTGADEAALQKVLAADTGKKIKAVCVVHNETTTGVTSDVKGVRDAMDSSSHPALLLVDGVSSIGALEFKFDDWKVDVAVTGSQKALSLPTGLALLAVSEKALAARKHAGMKRCYYDWEDMIATNAAGSVPYTPSIPLLYGLKESLDLLKAEGFDNVVKRHHRLAEGTRKAVKAWGLELLCREPRWRSDSLTVIESPAGLDSARIVAEAYKRYNLSIGVGLSKVAGKVFRIGHLGNCDEVMQASALAGTEMALLSCGVKIEPGRGVGAALEYWAETSKVIPTRCGSS